MVEKVKQIEIQLEKERKDVLEKMKSEKVVIDFEAIRMKATIAYYASKSKKTPRSTPRS